MLQAFAYGSGARGHESHDEEGSFRQLEIFLCAVAQVFRQH